MKSLLLALPALMIVSTCVTTGPVTAEERARCQAMAERMGTSPQHSHAEEKGTVTRTPMNRRHDRCRAIERRDAAQQRD